MVLSYLSVIFANQCATSSACMCTEYAFSIAELYSEFNMFYKVVIVIVMAVYDLRFHRILQLRLH